MTLRHETASAAFGALVHPASIAAIGILLINDHVMKQVAPSWLTGKISDFAGLYFAPFVVLVVWEASLGVVIPRISGRTVALATYVTVGLFFAAFKVSSEAADAFVRIVGMSGVRISIVVDPTDLVAVVSLPLSYALWSRQRRYAARAATIRPLRRVAVLTAAALAIAATSAAQPTLTSIAVDSADGDLLYAVLVSAGDNDGLYVSDNGGLGWLRVSTMTGEISVDPAHARTAYILDAPDSDSALLRLKLGSRPVEIGPGRRGQGTYDLHSSFIAVGPWPTPVLYYGFRGSLWITEDDGVQWRNIGLGEPVYALAPTTTPGLLYAASYGYVLRSADGGKTWTHVVVLPGNGDVTSLVAHGQDPQLLLAGIGKEIRRSTDGGVTWTSTIRYEGNTRLEFAHWKIVFDPRDPDRAYALFGGGCCSAVYSVDRGRTWQEWGQAVQDIAVTADADYPLVAISPSGSGVLRHRGVVPGAWDSVGGKLPLKN